MKGFIALMLGVAVFAAGLPAVADGLAEERRLVAQLQEPYRILLMRHALAPGTGDPPGFDIGDCATQRNLSADGREQARATGERLRAAGLDAVRVFAGPWCRNYDTAELLGFGRPVVLDGLGSIFRTNAPDREWRMVAIRAHLAAEFERGAGPAVYVTHRANILELAGRSVGAGGMVVVALDADGTTRLVE